MLKKNLKSVCSLALLSYFHLEHILLHIIIEITCERFFQLKWFWHPFLSSQCWSSGPPCFTATRQRRVSRLWSSISAASRWWPSSPVSAGTWCTERIMGRPTPTTHAQREARDQSQSNPFTQSLLYNSMYIKVNNLWVNFTLEIIIISVQCPYNIQCYA